MAANVRLTKLSKVASGLGLRIESGDAGYRVVDDSTGTFVAADWAEATGFGLTIDEVDAAITAAGS